MKFASFNRFDASNYFMDKQVATFFNRLSEYDYTSVSLPDIRTLVDRECDLAICVTEEFGEFVHINDAFTKLYGYEVHELLGRHCTIVVPPKYKPLAVDYHNKVIAETTSDPTVCVNLKKNGEKLVLVISPVVLHDASGKKFIISVLVKRENLKSYVPYTTKSQHTESILAETAS